MKRNILQWTGIAALSALSLTACHPDKVKEEPILAVLLSSAVRGAAAGNCAISVNATGLYFGNVLQTAISYNASGNPLSALGLGATFVAHYNNLNGSSLTGAQLRTNASFNNKFDAFFTDKDTWNDEARATYLESVRTAGAIAAGLTTVNNARGTGILACAKIPRANCNIAGLTTATRQADLDSKNAIVKLIAENPSCRKASDSKAILANLLYRGAPDAIQTAAGATTISSNEYSFGSGTTVNQILAEKAYPKFGNLVSLGFGFLMPVRSGKTVYSLSSTAFTNGSNINATVVDSCESIGISTGLTAKPLSSVSETVYANTNQGTAAATYSAHRALSASAANFTDNDAIECNASFRAAVDKGLPLSLKDAGIFIDQNIYGTSGDGARSDSLGLCLYGGTSAARTALGTALTASLGAAPPNCDPTKALTAVQANAFGDTGLTSFKANDANNAIDGE